MQVWLKVNDDPESCYSLIEEKDLTVENIWLMDKEGPDGEQVEVPGLVIGERRIPF